MLSSALCGLGVLPKQVTALFCGLVCSLVKVVDYERILLFSILGSRLGKVGFVLDDGGLHVPLWTREPRILPSPLNASLLYFWCQAPCVKIFQSTWKNGNQSKSNVPESVLWTQRTTGFQARGQRNVAQNLVWPRTCLSRVDSWLPFALATKAITDRLYLSLLYSTEKNGKDHLWPVAADGQLGC